MRRSNPAGEVHDGKICPRNNPVVLETRVGARGRDAGPPEHGRKIQTLLRALRGILNMNALQLAGRKIGRWTVIARDGSLGGQSAWACVCDCGARKRIRGCVLRRRKSLSCGCLARDDSSARNRTHGMKGTKEYKAWDCIKQRCLNPNHKDFARYGGSGITISAEWLESFEAFFRDMGLAPTPTHSVDRKRGTEGYSKDNCRWATPREQAQNMRSNRPLFAFGETKLLCEWARDIRCAVKLPAFEKRLAAGWSTERALITPKRRAGR